MPTQFDVHRHPQPGRRADYPYLVIVQHERVLLYAGEALVVPLGRPLGLIDDRLMPPIELAGETFQFYTPLMLRVSAHRLQAPIDNLAQERSRIIAAIDLLFTGS